LTTEVETARATLADLEGKLAAITARSIELANERRLISFAANTGDSAAEKKLKALNTEAAHINLDAENVRSAIDEAKRRLAIAIRDEQMAGERKNAEEAKVIGERLVEHARAIDAAFATAQAEMTAMKRATDRLHELGCVNPSAMQFSSFGGRAVSAFLMNLPVRADHGHLAPSERRVFLQIATGWRDSVARWAGRYLISDEAA
jgi:hypothetical protein